jgi:hypothetical protein
MSAELLDPRGSLTAARRAFPSYRITVHFTDWGDKRILFSSEAVIMDMIIAATTLNFPNGSAISIAGFRGGDYLDSDTDCEMG